MNWICGSRVGRARSSAGLSGLFALYGAEAFGEGLEQVPGDGCVVLDERSELPIGQSVADEIGVCGDRRRTCAFVDEGDLAEIVAGGQCCAWPAPDRDGGFARVD